MPAPHISNPAIPMPWPVDPYADPARPFTARAGGADKVEDDELIQGFDDPASSLDAEADGRAQRAHRDAINAPMLNRLRHSFLRGQPQAQAQPQPQPQQASWHSPMFNPLGTASGPSTGMSHPQWAPAGLPSPGEAWTNLPPMPGFGFSPPFVHVGRYGFNAPFVGSPGMSFSPFDRTGGMCRHLLSGGVGMALGLGLGELASGIGAFIGSALGGYGRYGGYGAFGGFRHGFGRDWCDFSPSYCGWW